MAGQSPYVPAECRRLRLPQAAAEFPFSASRRLPAANDNDNENCMNVLNKRAPKALQIIKVSNSSVEKK